MKPVVQLRANYKKGFYEVRFPRSPSTAVIDPDRWWVTAIATATETGRPRPWKAAKATIQKEWDTFDVVFVESVNADDVVFVESVNADKERAPELARNLQVPVRRRPFGQLGFRLGEARVDGGDEVEAAHSAPGAADSEGSEP
jgi:hypothetical protein